MANAIFNGLLNFIKTIADIFLAPVNLVVSNAFPDLSNTLTSFSEAITTLIGSNLGFFSNILPPITRGLIPVYLTILIGGYASIYAVHLIIKIITIIKNIKIW